MSVSLFNGFSWNDSHTLRVLEKRELEPQEFLDQVQGIFKERLEVSDSRIFNWAWDQAKEAGRFGWNRGEKLTVEEFQKIGNALKETLLFHGNGMEVEGAGSEPTVHEIVQFLLGRGEASSNWATSRNIKGILLRKDPKLLGEMKEEFRLALYSCAGQLPVVGAPEEILFQAFVSNIVALLPYCYPEAGDQFLIPQKIEGVWKSIPYTVDHRFKLSPYWLSSPIAAYGLISPEGPPLMTFLGTTFPAGEGFLATLLSDFTPLMSVGHAPYLYGKIEIGEWLKEKTGVRLFGMSLGGALTMHVLRNHPSHVEEVHAVSPAGLYPWNWRSCHFDAKLHIYYQENDLVPTLGFFPEGENVHVYRVIGAKVQNPLSAHARVFAGGEQVTLLKGDPAYENSRLCRKLITLLHLLVGIAASAVILLVLIYAIFRFLVLLLLGLI